MGRGFLGTALSAAESQTVFSNENWKVLRAFNIYRLLIAGTAAGLALSGVDIAPFGAYAPRLFELTSLVYAGVALVALVAIRQRWGDLETLTGLLAFADIVLLTLLMHASHGIESGAGLLLLVAIAGASLVLGTRLTILFAALATIALGIEVNWTFLAEGEWIASRWDTSRYNQLGLLGIGLFVTAGLTHFLARRLRATEALAEQRGVDLANLAQLNELVIARMQSGVVACDVDGHVHMLNKTARGFLGTVPDGPTPVTLAALSPELAGQLQEWQSKGAASARNVIQTRGGYSLLPRFLPIGERREDRGVLIFLEDMTVVRQQAAQFKMAALARLTASIAHEIRNPLGAIAHAAQLLTESGSRPAEDDRLLRIIHDQSRRMNVIIENVTQLSRRDKINPMPIRLELWIPDFIRQFTLDGQNSPAIFQAPAVAPVAVCFDPEQLHQVVHNLATNALRHSPPFTGQALIAFQTGHDRDRRPYLDVIDWGKGVPAEIAESIFDPFYTTTPKGTGLGLYISRELCEGNGARLEHYPGDQGVGARFRVTFARAEECTELTTGMP